MNKKVEVSFSEGEGVDKVEFSGVVTLKKLNWSEMNSLQEEASEVKFLNGVPTVKVLTSKMKELSILKSCVDSNLHKTTYVEDKVKGGLTPVVVEYKLDNVLKIRDLPQEVGEELFNEFQLLNTLNSKKNEISS